MTQKKVEVIPATKRSVHNGGQLKVQSNIRVAAYCRVSTGDESQQTSYTTQKAFYTNLITNKPGWRFAGIYADEAKSGTSREHREDFNRMMADALDGKLDYIVTKSISRFARNTVDTLNCVFFPHWRRMRAGPFRTISAGRSRKIFRLESPRWILIGCWDMTKAPTASG